MILASSQPLDHGAHKVGLLGEGILFAFLIAVTKCLNKANQRRKGSLLPHGWKTVCHGREGRAAVSEVDLRFVTKTG